VSSWLFPGCLSGRGAVDPWLFNNGDSIQCKTMRKKAVNLFLSCLTGIFFAVTLLFIRDKKGD